MPDLDNAVAVTIDTYNHIASTFAVQHTSAIHAHYWQDVMQRFVSVLRINPASQEHPSLPVVDVGCGPGRDSLLLAQMDLKVRAVDLSEAMLNEARKHCAQQPMAEHITFGCMDMHHLDLPDSSCAGVWASASFLHIPKHENLTVLKELIRVLISGGPIMLLVKEYDHGEAERYEIHQQSGKSRFFARYRGSELWELLEQAGIQVLEITTTANPRSTDRLRWLGALGTKS